MNTRNTPRTPSAIRGLAAAILILSYLPSATALPTIQSLRVLRQNPTEVLFTGQWVIEPQPDQIATWNAPEGKYDIIGALLQQGGAVGDPTLYAENYGIPIDTADKLSWNELFDIIKSRHVSFVSYTTVANYNEIRDGGPVCPYIFSSTTYSIVPIHQNCVTLPPLDAYCTAQPLTLDHGTVADDEIPGPAKDTLTVECDSAVDLTLRVESDIPVGNGHASLRVAGQPLTAGVKLPAKPGLNTVEVTSVIDQPLTEPGELLGSTTLTIEYM